MTEDLARISASQVDAVERGLTWLANGRLLAEVLELAHREWDEDRHDHHRPDDRPGDGVTVDPVPGLPLGGARGPEKLPDRVRGRGHRVPRGDAPEPAGRHVARGQHRGEDRKSVG